MPALLTHLRDLVGDPLTIAFTALRVVLVYGAILIGLRLGGRRLLGQVTPFDLVTLLLLSNVVQNGMIGPDMSLVGSLVGVAVLLVANRAISRSAWARTRLEGHPVLLVHRGHVQSDALAREHVSQDEPETAGREHGFERLEDIESAILEMDGTISVIGRGHAEVKKKIRKVRSSRNR